MTAPAVVPTQGLCLCKVHTVSSVCGYDLDSLPTVRDGGIPADCAFPIACIRLCI